MAQVRRSTGRNWVRSQPRVKRTTQGKDSQEDTNQQTHGLMGRGGGGLKFNHGQSKGIFWHNKINPRSRRFIFNLLDSLF